MCPNIWIACTQLHVDKKTLVDSFVPMSDISYNDRKVDGQAAGARNGERYL